MSRRRLRLSCVAVALALLITCSSSIVRAQPGPGECAPSLQSQIDAAPAGATLHIGACIYRETVTVGKPLTLVGQPGSEIRGSDIWTGWKRTGSNWIEGPVPPLPVVQDSTRCARDAGNRCLSPEQVFVDGRPLERVDGNPISGQFALDSARNILLADDPNRHMVEVTVRTRWLVTAADDVTIHGFTMRHAANDAQTGAISNDGRSGWTLEDSQLTDAHGAVVSLSQGHGNRLLRNDIRRGGQLGVAMGNGGSDSADVEGNHIHDNNTAHFEWHWEAGGLKATAQTNLLIDSNEVDHNRGPGLWCDIGCHEAAFSHNRVHDNTAAGIFFEISSGAQIFGNSVWANGFDQPVWGYGAGILVASSAGAEVYDNVSAWNARGIVVLAQQRADGPAEGPVDNYVHDNIVVQADVPDDPYNGFFLGWMDDYPSALFAPGSNNRGQDDRYWAPTADGAYVRFGWGEQPWWKLSDFSATPGDVGGRYLSAVEKDQLLARAGVPAEPGADGADARN